MQRADLLEKTLMLGKMEGKRRREPQRTRWLDSIATSVDINLSKLWEIVTDIGAGMLQSTGFPRVGHDLVTYQQQKKQERLELSLPCKDTALKRPGEFHRLYNFWGCIDSDTTELLSLNFSSFCHIPFLSFECHLCLSPPI